MSAQRAYRSTEHTQSSPDMTSSPLLMRVSLAAIPNSQIHAWPAPSVLIHGRRKYDRVTPLFQNLHWLSGLERIKLRLAVLVFRCRSHTAPAYLASDLHWATDNNSRQRLRSSATHKIEDRATYTMPHRRRLSILVSLHLLLYGTTCHLPSALRLLIDTKIDDLEWPWFATFEFSRNFAGFRRFGSHQQRLNEWR